MPFTQRFVALNSQKSPGKVANRIPNPPCGRFSENCMARLCQLGQQAAGLANVRGLLPLGKPVQHRLQARHRVGPPVARMQQPGQRYRRKRCRPVRRAASTAPVYQSGWQRSQILIAPPAARRQTSPRVHRVRWPSGTPAPLHPWQSRDGIVASRGAPKVPPDEYRGHDHVRWTRTAAGSLPWNFPWVPPARVHSFSATRNPWSATPTGVYVEGRPVCRPPINAMKSINMAPAP